MKSSAFARSVELAKLAARVGLKEALSSSVKSRLEQASLIVNSLSQLKGAAMKAGQLLSLDLNHHFPPEAIELLSQLQSSAIAKPYDEIEKIIKSELGFEKFNSIKNISKEPLGVASIGQVHRAEYMGKEIVLKVQYDQIADSIESDLKILKGLATSFCQLSGRRMNLGPLFNEFKNILEQEVNYKKEVAFQKEYYQLVSHLNSNEGFSYRVPKIIEDLSTNRVIGMTFENGLTLRNWLKTQPSRDQKDRLAVAILDLYFHEFFEWGLVQTDPNWANFLVDESNQKSELVILDFGAARNYDRDFIHDYIKLLHFAAREDEKSLHDLAIELGLLDPRESESAFLAFKEMVETAIRPFFASRNGSVKFDFSDPAHSLNSQNAARALAKELVYSPPPYKIIFLHRKLAGVYSILKTLEVSLDVSKYWEMMEELSRESVSP